MMIRGVGLFCSLRAKDVAACKNIQQALIDHVQKSSPKRATMVIDNCHVVMVEEWESEEDYQQYYKEEQQENLKNHSSFDIQETHFGIFP